MDEKIRYLLIDANDAVGGVVTAHLMLLRALDQERFAPHLACLGHGPLLPAFQALPGVTRWTIEVGTKPAAWCGGLLGKAMNLFSVVPLAGAAIRLAWLCRRHGIQVIHTSDKKRSLLLTLLLHRLTRIPYLYHIHNNYIDYPANRRALAGAAAIIANSGEMRRDFIGHLGASMARIRVVHNGIDAVRFRPGLASTFRQQCGAAPDELLVGIASRLAPDKGQETLLRAAAKIVGQVPRARFVIIGDAAIFSDNRDYPAELRRLAAELGIAQRVTFTGFCADMAAVYPALDVVVNAARREAFGLVVVEAMACGKVVIGTDAGGIPEIITHGQDGFLFPPGDADKLAKLLLPLLRDPRQRETLGTAARQTVQARFTIEKQARLIEQVCVSLAHGVSP
jgi:glycosyltransferase involved in cell wall biosynthesis